MWRAVRIVGVAVATIAGTFVVAGGSAMATGYGHPSGSYTCSGGDIASENFVPIPSGNYTSITVTGACTVPAGAVINVARGVFVAPGAALDAQSAPSTLTVGRDVVAAPGSWLGLGCQPPSYTGNSAHECTVDPDGHSTVVVKGSVAAFGVTALFLNGITVRRNVTVLGGGGPIPWSIKNNDVGANIVVAGVTTEWLGVMFNNVGGNTVLLAIHVTDSEHPGGPLYVVRNNVVRNLVCGGITPDISGGFVPGSVNVVGGRALGQCASLVAPPSPPVS